MNLQKIVQDFWRDVTNQDADKLKLYFTQDAIINWHNTNESFDVDEYIIANCEYPGDWQGEVERIEEIGDLVISINRSWFTDESAAFRATSFFKFNNGKIELLDEYWGDEAAVPRWREAKKIGRPIK